MISKEARRRACIAASLAVAWNAVPSIVHGKNSAPDGSIAYTHFSWSSTVLNVRLVGLTALTYIDYLVGDVPAGETFRSVGLGSGSSGLPWDRYAFVGLGSGTSVMISFSDPAVAVGRDFETVFGMPEASAYAMIQQGGAAMNPLIDKLNQAQGFGAVGAVAAAVLFSNGTQIGTVEASFSELPEPSGVIVCLGALGLCTLRRYRSAVATTVAA